MLTLRILKLTNWSLAVVLSGLLLGAHAETGTKSSERSRQKQVAEQERADLRKKLATLKEDIAKTEKARVHAADALSDSEAAISNANRSLRELATEQAQTQTRLVSLSKSQEELEAAVLLQRARLETILRDQYVAGHDDRIRLLLSGDNPNRMSRELRYLGYVSAAQSKAIEQLQANLAAIEANKAEAEEARLSLEEIASEQREQKTLLEKQKANRKLLVSQLSSKLGEQRKEAGNLARDEERLGSLLEKLANIIAQQRKADEAEAQRRARQAKTRAKEREMAAEKSAGEAAAGKTAPSAQASRPAVKDSPKPAAEDVTATRPIDDTGLASQRGKLRMPVKGELLARFGARRADGPSWKGLFIKAPEGTEISSAAAGEVIFADWMRGFGNLLIVDHGGQYMSIYGNNQALLKRPGDKVKAGDFIATAGNSGGNEQSGLYFELRYQGRAIDPLAWINR
jgi:septal ring factor EnvC (AmiA/AmiB activator)